MVRTHTQTHADTGELEQQEAGGGTEGRTQNMALETSQNKAWIKACLLVVVVVVGVARLSRNR